MKQCFTQIAVASIVIAIVLSPSVLMMGQVKSPPSEKTSSIVLSTINKMKAEGITAKNAHVMNIPQRYNSHLTRFDDQGRFGLMLHVRTATATLLETLRELGGDVVMALPSSNIISVYVPIDNVESIAELDEVMSIQPVMGGVTNAGGARTEGDSIHHAFDVRRDLNVKGDGMNVGVISDGCTNWAAAMGSGDLPPGFNLPNFTFLNGMKIGKGDEGTAMMEIVHDVAPNSDIYFYGALRDPAGSAAHVDAIQRLVREKGCRVIVDDLTWFDQPMFEDGTPATNWTVAAAAKWANDTGVVYVSSAGNWADGPPNVIDRSHYEATYLDINPGSNVPEAKPLPNGPILPGAPPNWDDLHIFGPDPSQPAGIVGLEVHLPAWAGPPNPRPTLNVILEWDDPWGASADDYDLYIYDRSFMMRRAASMNFQGGAGNPYEAVADSNYEYWDDTVNVVINHVTTTPKPPKLLGLYISGAKWVEYFTPPHSIWGQPGVPQVIAVGGVPYNNINNNESYSSQGNYDVYFPAFRSREKPDMVAADGVAITGAGGFGRFDPGSGKIRFWGTSASAPHVAGMAALLLSRCPNMTPAQVHAKFERTAVDLGTAGFDAIYGNGRADIERAMLELDTTAAVNGFYTMGNTVNVPMFFANDSGYALNNIKITGGASQPAQVHSKVTVTNSNPYTDAGIVNLGCPTVKRWYDVTKTGGTDGQFNAQITAYIDESERSLSGLDSSQLNLLHWNGSFFDVKSQSAVPALVRNTWKVQFNVNNASFSPYFLGNLTRSLDVATISNATGKNDSAVAVSISLQNTGNGWDTLRYHVRDTRGWTFAPIDSGLSLAKTQFQTVGVRVTISSSDTAGTVDTLWLTAKSVSDSSVSDSSFATVTIVPSLVAGSYQVSRGWNMVSVPFYVENCLKSSLYPAAVSRAFTYQNGYVTKDSVFLGIGYWIKFPDTGHVEMTGYPCISETVSVVKGWNMIGSISGVLHTDEIGSDPGAMIVSKFFGYDVGYYTTDSIQPGTAYWVKVNRDGKLILSSSAPPQSSNRIRILASGEMPPSPPGENLSASDLLPREFSLEQNYPNPFNPATVIHYQLPVNVRVSLRIYDILGREVATLVDGEQDAGYKHIEWDGVSMPSGVYYCRLHAGSFVGVRTMVLIR